MPVIQYVMPSKNKQLKKLLHFYWEVCPKYDENGKLKQEMILVVCALLYFFDQLRSADYYSSNAIRNDLVSAFVLMGVMVLKASHIAATSKRVYPWCYPTLPPEDFKRC